MSTNCPKNDTDCLLRALVDVNSGFNWNPLNFAFTAALSILGFVVAIVTLIQGLLAAGPGRLKASRSAVGSVYSQKAHTRFDRTELRFRTLVRVPVLDVERLLGPELIPAPNRRRISRASRHRNAAGSLKESSRSLAGWSRLLEDLDLDDFQFATLPCATDYLPTDVQAALAYASVESLVIMALLAGCENIQPAEGFLRVTGPDLQLEFRSHQTLGIVAAYQHYFSTEERGIDNSSHAETIHEALGHLRYSGDMLFELKVKWVQANGTVNIAMVYEALTEEIDRQRAECNHPGCASRKDTVASWTDFLHDEKPNQSDIDKLTTLLFANKPTTARMFPTAATDFRRLLNDMGNRKYKDTWFHQSTVAQDLALLPESDALVDIKNLEQFGTLRVREFQNRDDSTWFKNTKYLSKRAEGFGLANLLPTKSDNQMSCLRSMALEAFHSESADTKVLEEDSILISDQALTACFSWLANSDLFVTMESASRAGTRENLMLQLREVDWWLGRHGGTDALCSALSMIKDLQGTAPLEDEADNLPQPDAGSDHENDEPKKHKRKLSSEPRILDSKDDSRPTWIRCNRKWLAPETVNHYKLPWEFDRRDPAYLIIKEWIPDDFQAELFEHTRRLQSQEKDDYTTNMRDARGDHSYRIRKRGKWNTQVPSKMSRDLTGDGWASNRLRYSQAGRMRQASSKDTRNAHGSQHDLILEGQMRSDNLEERESLDRGYRGTDTANPSTGNALIPSSVPSRRSSRNTEKTSTTHSANEAEDGKRSRMKAMETMLLYRAMLFACLLATGTDTSELLWLENRNRIVQVL